MSIVPQQRRRPAAAAMVLEIAVVAAVAAFGARAWQRAHSLGVGGATGAAAAAQQANATPHTATAGAPRALAGHSQYVSSVAFSPDGRLVASGSADKTILIHDVATGDLAQRLTGSPNTYWVAFSPDGKTLASAGEWPYDPGQFVVLWNFVHPANPGGFDASGAMRRTLDPHAQFVGGISWSADGKTLAAGIALRDVDSAIVLWNARTGREVLRLDGYAVPAFSPDGRLLAGVDQQGVVELFAPAAAPAALQPIRALAQKVDALRAIVWSADGRTLATASDGPTMQLWDPATGRLLSSVTAASYVNGAAFSPDGRTLATANEDHTITLWDAGSGAKLRTLTGHGKGVNCVAFSPDGRLLASGGADNAVLLWPLR